MTKQQENLQNGCGDAAAGQQVMLGGGADDEEEGMDEREDAARLLLPGDQGDADMADITRQQFPSDLEIHEDGKVLLKLLVKNFKKDVLDSICIFSCQGDFKCHLIVSFMSKFNCKLT